MKEKTINRVARAVRSVFGALFGDGVKRPTDHIRQVRGTNLPDMNC